MDLVSVIIPYFKKRKFISETVDSAVNQSYKNLGFYLELIELGFLNYTNEKSNISIHYGFAPL